MYEKNVEQLRHVNIPMFALCEHGFGRPTQQLRLDAWIQPRGNRRHCGLCVDANLRSDCHPSHIANLILG